MPKPPPNAVGHLYVIQEMESTEDQISSALDLPFSDIPVYVSRETGVVVWDDEPYSGEPCPIKDIDEDPDYICVPSKQEFRLGLALVFKFARERFPEEEGAVERIFKKKGAYSRFKDFLDRKDSLEEWYDFEEKERRRVIVNWCEREGVKRIV